MSYAMIDSVSDDAPKATCLGEDSIRVTCGIYVSLILSASESVALIAALSDALYELKTNHALSQENSHDSYNGTTTGRTPPQAGTPPTPPTR
nr:hypothetical protein [Rhodococcus sp. 15-649-1-2]